MERRETFQFSDDELKTLESALALYAAYTREMEVNMLVGDESDCDAVMADHNRAKSMHQQFYKAAHETPMDEERAAFARIHGRPMDINDFSAFDWYEYVQE
jgi:hypothetical protein